MEAINNSYTKLCKAAKGAAKNAYVPYSGFSVGAALLCESGNIYLGCNIENKSFGGTVCAERTAFFKAISEGERSFLKIAIVGFTDESSYSFCTPCGICRQVMSEFCGESFEIVLSDSSENLKVYKLPEILPFAFEL